MASIGFDPNEITQLCQDVAAVKAVVEGVIPEIDGLFNQITGDAVMGDSVYKDELIGVKKSVDGGITTVATILQNVVAKANATGEKVGIAVDKINVSVEEQASLISAAAAKLEQK